VPILKPTEINMKSNSVMTCTTGADELLWTFTDGHTLAFQPSRCTAAIGNQAMFHGFKQKIGDAAAMSRNTETGLPATVVEKREAMKAIVNQLYNGDWNGPREREAGGDLADAIAIVKKCERAKAVEWLKGKSEAEKRALRVVKAIKHELDKIAAARGKAAGVDGDEILSGF
jgi:hypothetical protein